MTHYLTLYADTPKRVEAACGLLKSRFPDACEGYDSKPSSTGFLTSDPDAKKFTLTLTFAEGYRSFDAVKNVAGQMSEALRNEQMLLLEKPDRTHANGWRGGFAQKFILT